VLNAILLLSWWLSVQSPGVADIRGACRQNYTSTGESHVLPLDYFTADSLRTYFSRALERGVGYEHTILVTSDPVFLDEIRNLKPVVGLSGVFPKIRPLRTSSPVARLHKFGGNAFFEYRDREGGVGWAVVQGENLLSRSCDGVAVEYYGQVWWADNPAGEGERRRLVLVAPEMGRLTDSSARELSAGYDSAFPCPYNLEIQLYEHARDAQAEQLISVPAVRFLGQAVSDAGDSLGHLTKYYRWSRHKSPLVVVER
jgi:hypothetical protein